MKMKEFGLIEIFHRIFKNVGMGGGGGGGGQGRAFE